MTTDTYSEVGQQIPWIAKDPDATLDYSFNWGDWLAQGEDIASRVVTVSGVTLVSDSLAGDIVTAWVSGGVAGVVASITCKITTNASTARIEQRTVYLKIRER